MYSTDEEPQEKAWKSTKEDSQKMIAANPNRRKKGRGFESSSQDGSSSRFLDEHERGDYDRRSGFEYDRAYDRRSSQDGADRNGWSTPPFDSSRTLSCNTQSPTFRPASASPTSSPDKRTLAQRPRPGHSTTTTTTTTTSTPSPTSPSERAPVMAIARRGSPSSASHRAGAAAAGSTVAGDASALSPLSPSYTPPDNAAFAQRVVAAAASASKGHQQPRGGAASISAVMDAPPDARSSMGVNGNVNVNLSGGGGGGGGRGAAATITDDVPLAEAGSVNNGGNLPPRKQRVGANITDDVPSQPMGAVVDTHGFSDVLGVSVEPTPSSLAIPESVSSPARRSAAATISSPDDDLGDTAGTANSHISEESLESTGVVSKNKHPQASPELSSDDEPCPLSEFNAALLQETQNMFWSSVMTAQRPLSRNCHAAAGNGRYLYVFGGFGGSRWFNDLWMMDSAQFHWQPISANGVLPPPRYAHTMVLVQTKLVVFGGYGGSDGWLADVFLFDLETNTWTRAQCTGQAPQARAAHTSVAIASGMYVFGGNSGDTRFNDLHFLDTETMHWTRLDAKGAIPSARAGHTMVPLNDTRLLLFGGGDITRVFNDIHFFDIDKCTWYKPSVIGALPPPRAGHTSVLVGTYQFVFGGGDVNRVLHDLHVLNTETMTWFHTFEGQAAPSARAGHSSTALGPGIFSFGGGDATSVLDDLYLLNTGIVLRALKIEHEVHANRPVSLPRKAHMDGDVETLDEKLRRREDKEELVRRNILKPDNVDSSLSSVRQVLVQRVAEDKLANLLKRRPDRTDLEQRGIVKSSSLVDPSLQATQAKFSKQRNCAKLSQLLDRRPTKAELERQNIIQEQGEKVSPALHAARLNLARSQVNNTLAQKLEHRPRSTAENIAAQSLSAMCPPEPTDLSRVGVPPAPPLPTRARARSRSSSIHSKPLDDTEREIIRDVESQIAQMKEQVGERMAALTREVDTMATVRRRETDMVQCFLAEMEERRKQEEALRLEIRAMQEQISTQFNRLNTDLRRKFGLRRRTSKDDVVSPGGGRPSVSPTSPVLANTRVTLASSASTGSLQSLSLDGSEEQQFDSSLVVDELGPAS